MKPRLYIPNEQNGFINASDSEFVLSTISVDSGAHDFDSTLAKYVQGGNVNVGSDGLVVVGGRKSIFEAFGHIPVQNYSFRAMNGQMLFLKFSRCAPGRGKVIDYALQDAGNIFLGPVNHLVTAVDRIDQKNRQLAARAGSTGPAPKTTSTVGGIYGALMKGTYHPGVIAKKMEVYDEGMKKKTVLRVFAAPANFNGVNLGAAVTGAGISLRLRQLFNV